MRAGTQIYEAALVIEGNLRILRQIFNQLHLIRLTLVFHVLDCFIAGQSEPLQFMSFLDDLLHLRFQLIQVFPGKRLCVEIIIKSIFNGRPNGHLCLREQTLYRLRQYVGGRMSDHF